MVVPEDQLPGPLTITGIAFHHAAGSPSVALGNARVHLGTAGSGSLGVEFGGNRVSQTLVLERNSVSATADESGLVVLNLDEPWEYEGGHLLLEMSFGSVSGSLYVFGWATPETRYISTADLRSTNGRHSENSPVVTLITE